jgi:hypothetical protein
MVKYDKLLLLSIISMLKLVSSTSPNALETVEVRLDGSIPEPALDIHSSSTSSSSFYFFNYFRNANANTNDATSLSSTSSLRSRRLNGDEVAVDDEEQDPSKIKCDKFLFTSVSFMVEDAEK